MAGGTFYSQNKRRPGAYINFKKEDEEINISGSRGIVAVALPLNWGAEEGLINVTSADMTNGKSLAKVGLMSNDENAKILNLILENATLAKVYKINAGGQKATTTIGELTIEAKYPGTFGNLIALLITSKDSVYEVNTYADGYLVDTQKVHTIEELVANEFVIFSGKGTLTETASSKLLEGGTNGETTPTVAYNKFFEILRMERWQVLPICNNSSTINPLIVNFIKKMRNEEGKYVQAVVANYNEANYEGIINNVNGAVINGKEVTAEEFTAYVAGITAAASASTSNTGRIITGATSIIGQLSNDDIVEGLTQGKFILSPNQDGQIKVEQDINSLHTYTDELNYNFTKNKIIRVLDEIGTSIQSIWENTFLGKVANSDTGRDLFKSTIITYLQGLNDTGIIKEFAGSDDVSVGIGDNIDAVEATIKVKPIDAMEYLYLTVNVGN